MSSRLHPEVRNPLRINYLKIMPETFRTPLSWWSPRHQSPHPDAPRNHRMPTLCSSKLLREYASILLGGLSPTILTTITSSGRFWAFSAAALLAILLFYWLYGGVIAFLLVCFGVSGVLYQASKSTKNVRSRIFFHVTKFLTTTKIKVIPNTYSYRWYVNQIQKHV